jgi:hypothetical protein
VLLGVRRGARLSLPDDTGNLLKEVVDESLVDPRMGRDTLQHVGEVTLGT